MIERLDTGKNHTHPIRQDCLKEECAWWNSELEACAIVSLELELASLAEVLAAIGSKMPHEEQFRK